MTAKQTWQPPYHLGEKIGPKADLGLILLTTTLVNFLDLFQLSAVLFGLPDIQRSLNFTTEDINWVLIVYNITFASFLLIGGQLGQRLGLERTFIIGTAILTVSNIINTAAPNKAALLAGRCISGIGAGLTAPNGLAILSRKFADGEARNKALAVYTACAPLGSTIGTVVGSLLASSPAGWRSIFWLCLILTAISTVLACLFLPEFSREKVPIDVLGASVFTAGIALLVYGLNDSSRLGWSAPSVLVGIILGICLLLAFVIVEKRVANPAVPLYVWKSLPFFLMLVAIFAFGGSFSSWFFITTQLCVNLLRYTPVLTAVYFLPAAFCAIVSGALSTPMVKFLGEKATLVVGLVITAAGGVAWAFATPERAGGTAHGQGYWYSIVAAIIFVCGSPVAMVPAQSILLRQVEAGNHAVASALFNTAYQVGASVLLAGANALINAKQENVNGIIRASMEGYRDAFWLLTGVLGGAALIVAVFYWPLRSETSERTIEEALVEEHPTETKVH
ncbi:Major facilitator superfamily domain, general substrate transporter [Penicillium expansum]|uniref:Major facilitator superfamily domain, general substrate transporter n=1 Tax=Penicillium expansum TaxID=27334 RepID=A0A0A2K5S4_PENEN|nr:Major facilitator superfamily domain, general substrate transporter [Penicillium expansum]KGO62216.1 Major facilitator superfamily domain, general substrate transporter [Penicillium expansum]KGO66804.1 Major facilitator superfamily domain, general substrate transporter [Penicillium expansum]